jgi:hypothetical protein
METYTFVEATPARCCRVWTGGDVVSVPCLHPEIKQQLSKGNDPPINTIEHMQRHRDCLEAAGVAFDMPE